MIVIIYVPIVKKLRERVLVLRHPNLLSQLLLLDVNVIVQGVQEIRKLVHARKQITVRIMKNASVEGI